MKFSIPCENCKCKNVICLPRRSKYSFRNARAFQDRIGIWKCWFLRRGENRRTWRKTSRSRVENQQQTQPTYDAGSGNQTRDTLVGGERSHHCANPAPIFVMFVTAVCFLFLLKLTPLTFCQNSIYFECFDKVRAKLFPNFTRRQTNVSPAKQR